MDRPNAVYCRDLMFMTPEGAIITRPGMTARRGEERYVAQALAKLGVPILRTINGDGIFEGANAMWVDRKTVILATSIRTNKSGYEQVEYELKRIGVDNIIHMQIPSSNIHIGTTSAGVAEESTIDKVLKKGTLIVGTSPGYLPFEMIDVDGNYIGYDIDTANAIADAMGVKLEIKQYEFSALIAAVQSGEIDMIISGMTIRGDRALGASFANPYFEIRQVLMVPTSDNTTKTWEDLDVAGKKIAVGQGTTGALLAKQLFKNAEVVDYDGGSVASMALGQGLADGMVYDDAGVKMFVLQQAGKVKGIYDEMSVESLGIAVKYNDIKSVNWINSFLYGYKENPLEIESFQRWFLETDWMETLAEEQS